MPADRLHLRRQELYDSILLEHDLPALLGGLTLTQYLSRLPQLSTSPETEITAPQQLLPGLQ
jgi:hypothetical protein